MNRHALHFVADISYIESQYPTILIFDDQIGGLDRKRGGREVCWGGGHKGRYRVDIADNEALVWMN